MNKPHTDKLAFPQHFSRAFTFKPENLITVLDANVRNATVSGTYLLYEEHNSIPYLYRGKTVIDVYCSWYEWKPDRGCIRLILRNGEIPFHSSNAGVAFFTNIER